MGLFAFGCGGCTFISVDGADGVEVEAGVLRIRSAEEGRAVIYRSTGVGVVSGMGGTTVGFRTETGALIYAPQDCRLVLFQPGADELHEFRKLLEEYGLSEGTCIIGER